MVPDTRPPRIELCGRLVVEIDGERHEAAARGRQGRLLLAFLVLNRHVPVGRERLAGALWPGDLPRNRAGTLNTLLSGLRRSLGEERLEGRREIRLDLGPHAQVDVEVAVAARDAALDALSRSSFADAAERAREAVRITAADVLPGDDADWLERTREELRAVRADALETLARAQVQLGGPELAGAVQAASELVELAPFRESAYDVLMEAHAAAGNVAEALLGFERIRTFLRDELGTAPAPQLLEHHRRLLALERRPAAGAAAPGPGRSLPLPIPLARREGTFVGRVPALESLHAAFADAQAGERRFVSVAGEPGIGKTTLAAQIARHAHDAGATVLYGGCSEEPLLPYEPFVDALCHFIGHSPPESVAPEALPELDELGRWMPDLGRPARDTDGPLTVEPETRRFRMFEAMVDLLARLARDGPLVLVLDDLHWSDASALRLARHISRAVRLRGVLVILTFRDVELRADGPLAGLLGELHRDVGLEQLDLAGLDDAEARALIAEVGIALSDAVASRLHELTAGNPFFLGETLRTLAARPDAEREALREIALSPAVKDMIARRLGRLGPRAGDVLGTAAVLGPSFRLDVLEELARDDEPPALEILEEAIAAKLVVEVPGDAHRFSFAHALVREALWDGMSRIRRLRLHRQAGEVLERRRHEVDAAPAELAEHFFAAMELGEAPQALRYAAEAGRHAAESLAYEDAARQFTRALAAFDALSDRDETERCDLLLALGDAQLRIGSTTARETFARAAASARGTSPERLGLAAIGFGGRYYEAGVRDEELVALLEEALDALGAADSPLRARLLARLAEALHFSGEPGGALELSEEALAGARRVGDREALSGALAGRHVALLHVDHVEERLRVSAELTEFARREHRRELLVHAHHARLYDLFEIGDAASAREEHAALWRLAADLRQPLFRQFALSWSQVWAQLEGRFDEAERLAVELLQLQQELGAQDAETVFAARLFAIRRDQGRLGELAPVVEGFIELFPHFMPLRSALPLILHAAGDLDRARHELRAVGAQLDDVPRDFFWLSAMSWVAEASVALREATLAADMYGRLEPYGARTVQVGFAACLGSVERLLGLLAASGTRTAEAEAHFRRALEHDVRLGGRALVIRTEADFAEFLTTHDGTGDGLDARDLGSAALAGARQLQMAVLVTRLEPLFGTRRGAGDRQV